jgi:hypothetical protein
MNVNEDKHISTPVHSFRMSDVEDFEIYAYQIIQEWKNTEEGQWIMENAVEPPHWESIIDANTFGYKCVIVAKFIEAKYLYWKLRFR